MLSNFQKKIKNALPKTHKIKKLALFCYTEHCGLKVLNPIYAANSGNKHHLKTDCLASPGVKKQTVQLRFYKIHKTDI